MSSVEVRTLDRVPDAALVFASAHRGAMLFDGWQAAGWRLLLPWPEETRNLSWRDASSWRGFLDGIDRDTPGATETSLPFSGGWAGFVSYEATALDEGAALREAMTPEPAAFFALHRAGVAISPGGVAHLFAPPGRIDDYAARLSVPAASLTRQRAAGALADSLGHGLHQRLVETIREAIRNGEVYQVNLTRCYSADGEFDAAALYDAMTRPDPPRSSAFLRGDGWSIVSASPEVLLTFDRKRGIAESLPIKGTVRRHGDDAGEIAALLDSAKDESEHLMIVDVVRNDFGKIAPAGAVTVPHYRTVTTLRHVHHLESTVRAERLNPRALSDVVAALSPAASITGAPKRAAVGLIRRLEPVPRGVYCGSIGLIDSRRALLSVAIRTAVLTPASVRYHAGGGIVWDSEAGAEDAECRAKAEAFLHFVEEA